MKKAPRKSPSTARTLTERRLTPAQLDQVMGGTDDPPPPETLALNYEKITRR